jgi:DNA replication protein DnaC
MTEEIDQLLKNLKLRRILDIYDEQLGAAEKAGVSYSEFVAGLLRAQWHERQEGALEWRIERANLPERWSLETFPWARQPGVNRKQIRAFAELDFMAKHENLVFVGPTAVGKTGLDEFGYLNLKPEQSNTFFKLMGERYHRHSTIITTNLMYDEWHNFLGNKPMVEALLSPAQRAPRHYCHTVTIDGPPLRIPQG